MNKATKQLLSLGLAIVLAGSCLTALAQEAPGGLVPGESESGAFFNEPIYPPPVSSGHLTASSPENFPPANTPESCPLTEGCTLTSGHEGPCLPAEAEAPSGQSDLAAGSSSLVPGQSSPAEEAPAVSLLNIPAAAGSGTQEDPYRLGEEQLSTSGKTVVGISEDWLDSVGATAEDPVYVTVSLPSGYDTLGDRAFQHTDDSPYYLLGATWPGEYDYRFIGDYAFEGQDQLQYITMEGYGSLVPDLGYDEDYESPVKRGKSATTPLPTALQKR